MGNLKLIKTQNSRFLIFLISVLIFLSSFFTSSVMAQNLSQEPSDSLKTLLSVNCPNFDDMVNNYQRKFVSKMTNWSNAHLSQAEYQTAFYPFSGPDIVTVMSLYPKANYFVLVADQVPEYSYITTP